MKLKLILTFLINSLNSLFLTGIVMTTTSVYELANLNVIIWRLKDSQLYGQFIEVVCVREPFLRDQ